MKNAGGNAHQRFLLVYFFVMKDLILNQLNKCHDLYEKVERWNFLEFTKCFRHICEFDALTQKDVRHVR